MSKYFGTDGFRGEANVTLTVDHAFQVGRFLGWYYNMLRERNGDTNPARIVIGKDTRLGRRHHGLRCGRLPDARHHHAQRVLHLQGGRV